MHFNSTIYDAHNGARHLGLDIKNNFSVPLWITENFNTYGSNQRYPSRSPRKYDVRPDKFGYVYLEVRRGMYGLKESGIIAFKQLYHKLAPAGYHPCKQTPGFWTHATKRTTFTLCVDDFGVKYFSKADANHLIAAIK